MGNVKNQVGEKQVPKIKARYNLLTGKQPGQIYGEKWQRQKKQCFFFKVGVITMYT